MDKWDIRFLEMARLIGGWSKDPSSQCGSVIVRPDRTIASTGFNGFPRGMNDGKFLYEDVTRKHQRVIHAEINAILFAREPLEGFTIYNSKYIPCIPCCVAIIQSGIKKVFAPRTPKPTNNVSVEEYQAVRNNFNEADVELIEFKWESNIIVPG